MGLTMLGADAQDRLAAAELTYREVGATAGDLPDGYQHLTRRVVLGHGHQLFTGAGEAVLQWQVQVRAGLRVSVSSPVATPGATLILGLGIGPVRVKAPGRVVYVVDEPRRRGFAYGTLSGHPESGEEAFVIDSPICCMRSEISNGSLPAIVPSGGTRGAASVPVPIPR